MSPASEPDAARVARLPVVHLEGPLPLWRIHRHDRRPWFFSNSMAGRFDLTEPEGTCYLARSDEGAFLEVFRAELVAESELAARRISRFELNDDEVPINDPPRIADLTVAAARGTGVTAALSASADYGLCQRWAAMIRAAGFEGLQYRLSHDPSGSQLGVALFGEAGERPHWPAAPQVIDDDLVRRMQLRYQIVVVTP